MNCTKVKQFHKYQFEKEKKMNQLKEQIVTLNVDLEDKEKTLELLEKKLKVAREEVKSCEERIHDKYQQILQVIDNSF
jgi:predicted  nucleic acid-binding Zn-ribbon protein